jgi:undecaprenyl-diphosphatase
MLESLLQQDKELFLFLNGLGNESWDGFWMALSLKWTSIPLYLVLLIISYRVLGIKKTLLLLVAVTLLILVTDQLSNFFKYGVQRLRPCFESAMQAQIRMVKGYCGGRYGFYSAHASNSMAIAIFFSALFGRRYRFLVPFLIIWALVLAFSRIYLGVHYPLDVIAGAVAGLVLGWIFARLFDLAVNKLKL